MNKAFREEFIKIAKVQPIKLMDDLKAGLREAKDFYGGKLNEAGDKAKALYHESRVARAKGVLKQEGQDIYTASDMAKAKAKATKGTMTKEEFAEGLATEMRNTKYKVGAGVLGGIGLGVAGTSYVRKKQ